LIVKGEFTVFNAVDAVVPTFATAFDTVVEKLELFDMAFDNSYNVSSAAGAAPTKFETAKLKSLTHYHLLKQVVMRKYY
jgi:hypothetical protein